MRKLVILPALVVLSLSLVYAAWPAWSAWQLRTAVKSRNAAGIEARVDWPVLRANLKQTLNASLAEGDKAPESGGFTQALKRKVGTLVADTVVDVAVTPRTLVHVLGGRVLYQDLVRRLTPRRDDAADEEEADPLSPRRLRWAAFESSSRFRIEVADVKEPQRRIVSVLERQGFAWKLVDVYYRSPA